MMMKNLLFVVALLTVALWTGCATGGGGHTQGIQVTVASDGNATVVAVTLTLQFTATVTGTDNHAVTWSVSGNGCTGSACGTIDANGLYTAPATAPDPGPVNIIATSQADTSRSGSLSVTVVQITVTVTPKIKNGQLNVVKGLTQQFTATALPDAAPQTFNWSLACDAGANLCGTVDANGLYTAPNTIPNPATAQVKATSTIDATGFDTADIAIVKSRLVASSTYAFHFSGFDSGNAPLAVAGNFATDVNGAIVSGNEDELTSISANQCSILNTSTLVQDTNDHGTLTLRTNSGGCAVNARIFKVVLNAVGDGRMIEFDANGRGSGEIAQTVAKSKFKNSTLPAGSTFVFGLTGVSELLKRAGAVGLFRPDGLGGIGSGMLDINESITSSASTNVTGSYDFEATGDGRGTLALTDNTSGTTYNYAIYMVAGQTNKALSPLTLFVISVDDPQSRPAVSGTIVFQDPTPVPYDVADLNDFAVSSLTGLDGTGTHTLVSLTNSIGDGAGHISGTFDANNAGTIVKAQSFTCGYSSSVSGRYIVTLLGSGASCGSGAIPFVFYASANSRGFLLDQSSPAVYTGQMDLQPGANFAAAEMAGSFAAATVDPASLGVSPAALNLLFTSALPNFTVGGKRDDTDGGLGQVLAGTYTVSFDGTGTINLAQPAAQNYVIYLLDNAKDGPIQNFVMMNVDPANTDSSIIFAER
jgi:hypothetical protein